MGIDVTKRFFVLRLMLCLLSGLLIISCENSCTDEKSEITFSCWNVQTFFDAVNDGCEYSDFRKSKYWNKEAYSERLKRLARVIKELDCDVFVLEEIENEAVIVDVKNQLAGNSWNLKKDWKYSCFAKEAGAAIGCGIFSRLPLSDVRIHSMDVRSELKEQPSLRPILQVCVNSGERQLFLFVNHWKSKSGSESESDVWRIWQENLLTERVISLEKNYDFYKSYGSDLAVIMCGDFNKDISEFEVCADSSKGIENVILNGHEGICLKVYSPWLSSDGNFCSEIGSYWYKNNWERIDHIFSYGAASISEFQVFAKEPWANEKGIPIPYKIYTGNGYSDHLPLKCKVSF